MDWKQSISSGFHANIQGQFYAPKSIVAPKLIYFDALNAALIIVKETYIISIGFKLVHIYRFSIYI